MEQQEFDRSISERARTIRAEANVTQDRFAEMIGISKKTLVEVEKGRKTFGFTTAVTVAVLFRNGEIVQNLFGDAVLEVIDMCSRQGAVKPWYKTLGGHVFWTLFVEHHGYRMQHNRVTGHYRILDPENYLLYYSFDKEEVRQRFFEVVQQAEL